MSYTLVLYLGLMCLGIFIGSKKMSPDKEYKWILRIQRVALLVLLTALGIQLGADPRVFGSLREIGVSAFVIATFSMAGSVLLVYFVRKGMKLDKEGARKDD